MIVVDANILIRAVLGRRVRSIIENYAENVEFCAPEIAFAEAARHLPKLMSKRGATAEDLESVIDELAFLVYPIAADQYSSFESPARQRLRNRDQDDWPILATALITAAPLWTEDRDFFGTGVPTWTTDNIEIILRDLADAPAVPDLPN